MNDRDVHDFRLWYSHTYVRIDGWVVYVGESRVRSTEGDELELVAMCCTLDGTRVELRINNLSQVVPIKQVSRIVDTGTRLGQVFMTRSPSRQYKKSVCGSSVITIPPADVSPALIRNYMHTPLVAYSPQEAKERVLSGTALWSAVSDKMLVGAKRDSPNFSCMWRGRMIGKFAINKGEPDVKTLVISKPNGFLLESISEALPGVTCRVAR
jgi:hypothetical protein